MNRLKLNFDLVYSDERAEFLQLYLQDPQFVSSPPTEAELETMGNYVLWGKNRATGLNAKQDGSVPLSSKSRDWDDARKVTSLEALLESATFSENQFVVNRPPLKTPRLCFARDHTRAKCPPAMLPTFEALWAEIDALDLRCSFWAVAHGRQKSPVRPTLAAQFTPDQLAEAEAEADLWDPYTYLRARHRLIEMRRQQYALRDAYEPTPPTHDNADPEPVKPDISFGAEVEVLPLGLGPFVDHTPYEASLIFRDFGELQETEWSEDCLRAISKFYWTKARWKPGQQQLWFDFREPEHIYALCAAHVDLGANGDADVYDFEQMSGALLATLDFYVKQAQLTDIQRDIWTMKMDKQTNAAIAVAINGKYGTHYTENYISTIFCQKIIPRVAAAARLHTLIVENLPFEEEFKRCCVCGRRLLLNEVYFARRSRNATGYAGRCKCCDKKAR